MIAPASASAMAASYVQGIYAARQRVLMAQLALVLETSCPDLIHGAKNSGRCRYCVSLVPTALV